MERFRRVEDLQIPGRGQVILVETTREYKDLKIALTDVLIDDEVYGVHGVEYMRKSVYPIGTQIGLLVHERRGAV